MTNPDSTRARHTVAGETTDSYRWVVLGVTSIGALLASLTAGTLVIALPDILRDLQTDLFSLPLRGPHQVLDEPETEPARGRAVAA